MYRYLKRLAFCLVMATITSPSYGAAAAAADDDGSAASIAKAAAVHAAAVEAAISGFEAFKASAGVETIPGKIEYDYAYSLWFGARKSDRNRDGAIHFCALAAQAGYAKAQYRYGALLSHFKKDPVVARSHMVEGYNQLVKEYFEQCRMVKAKGSVDEKNELRDAEAHMDNLKSNLFQHCSKHAQCTPDRESIRIVFRLGANIKQFRDDLILLADKLNIAAAQYEYAIVLHREGESAQSADFFRKAADQGHADAQYEYSRILFRNRYVDESIKYLEFSANNGHAVAQYVYSRILFRNGYVDESIKYLEFSANNGYADAQLEYAFVLQTAGKIPEALGFLISAAKQRHARAQYIYSRILFNNGYVDESIKYLEFSADQGYQGAIKEKAEMEQMGAAVRRFLVADNTIAGVESIADAAIKCITDAADAADAAIEFIADAAIEDASLSGKKRRRDPEEYFVSPHLLRSLFQEKDSLPQDFLIS